MNTKLYRRYYVVLAVLAISTLLGVYALLGDEESVDASKIVRIEVSRAASSLDDTSTKEAELSEAELEDLIVDDSDALWTSSDYAIDDATKLVDSVISHTLVPNKKEPSDLDLLGGDARIRSVKLVDNRIEVVSIWRSSFGMVDAVLNFDVDWTGESYVVPAKTNYDYRIWKTIYEARRNKIVLLGYVEGKYTPSSYEKIPEKICWPDNEKRSE